jgi:hypothetical protein
MSESIRLNIIKSAISKSEYLSEYLEVFIPKGFNVVLVVDTVTLFTLFVLYKILESVATNQLF